MKVLIISTLFYPSIGGSQTNAEILAREFVNLGCEVKLITSTPGGQVDSLGNVFTFDIIRQPSIVQLLRHVWWCDVCLQNGLILRSAWAVYLAAKPLVIRHQTWIEGLDKVWNWKAYVKKKLLNYSVSIAISTKIAESLPFPSTLIHNPYRHKLFRIKPNVNRNRDIVYLGRLVRSKGVHVLFDALASLQKQQICPTVTIIGQGDEQPNLKRQAASLGLDSQVKFVGQQVGEALVELLNQHQIMVVPSLWNEPFGVVALEGIACGCVVVGSSGGGLQEAIGPCGLTFPNGEASKLAQILARLLSNPNDLEEYRIQAPGFLKSHRQDVIAQAYLSVLEATVTKH